MYIKSTAHDYICVQSERFVVFFVVVVFLSQRKKFQQGHGSLSSAALIAIIISEIRLRGD